MIRTLRLLFVVCLAVALLTVALANRAPVTVALLPEGLRSLIGIDLSATVPLFLVIFGGIVGGLLIGFVWEWFREMKHRTTATTKSREVTRLERELAVLKDQKAGPTDDILALLDGPKNR